MRSVKTKLFFAYSLIITIVLSCMIFISIQLLGISIDNKSLDSLNTTNKSIKKLLYELDTKDIPRIEKHINLENTFLLIFKGDKLIFTSKSKYRTKKIIERIVFKDTDLKKNTPFNELYKEFYEEGYIEIDEIIFIADTIKKENVSYEIYVGVDEKYAEESLHEIYGILLTIFSFILLVLLIAGYILINKTILPLKLILKDMKKIQEDDDLSRRLKELDTKDEFGQLVDSFNKMRDNIESSVENIKQFSSDASHELKTPITVIQGEIELAKNKDLNKNEIKKLLEKIDKEQKKLQDIISNFLLLSRLDKESIYSSKCSLDSVLFDAIEDNLANIENIGLELKLDIEEELEVNFPKKYLQIVLNNLLSNAVKYTNIGYIDIKAYKQDDEIFLSIEDSGIGISAKDQGKIFERFFRVDKVRTSSKDGIGLGLAIVKKICTKFNTQIEVNSIENAGSTFKIKFAKIEK